MITWSTYEEDQRTEPFRIITKLESYELEWFMVGHSFTDFLIIKESNSFQISKTIIKKWFPNFKQFSKAHNTQHNNIVCYRLQFFSRRRKSFWKIPAGIIWDVWVEERRYKWGVLRLGDFICLSMQTSDQFAVSGLTCELSGYRFDAPSCVSWGENLKRVMS